MSKIILKNIKKLRDETGAGIMMVKKALEEASGDEKKARGIIRQKGLAKLKKREGKETSEGQVFCYQHHDGRIAGMVKILCETDFVAKSDKFQKLGKEICMQIVSMQPKNVKELLLQKYIRDSKKTIKGLMQEVAIIVKEKITIEKIAYMLV